MGSIFSRGEESAERVEENKAVSEAVIEPVINSPEPPEVPKSAKKARKAEPTPRKISEPPNEDHDWDDPAVVEEVLQKEYVNKNAGNPYYNDVGRTEEVRAILVAYGFKDLPIREKDEDGNAKKKKKRKSSAAFEEPSIPSACFEVAVRNAKGDATKFPSIKVLARKIRASQAYKTNTHSTFPSKDAELVKYCLTDQSDYLWSFCRDNLESRLCVWHCRLCRTCKDWSEWHCRKCNKCQEGVTIPCKNCLPEVYKKHMPQA